MPGVITSRPAFRPFLIGVAAMVAVLVAACGVADDPAVPADLADTAVDSADTSTADRQTDHSRPVAVPAPPARPGAFAPRLVSAPSGLLLTWLEPLSPEDAPTLALAHSAGPPSPGHRLRFSRLAPDSTEAAWSEPVTVSQGENFFANWADFPSVAETTSGRLLAHWLEKNGSGTYAYGVRLARSDDGGATWEPMGWLHDDRSATEHGFVSLVPTNGADGPGFVAVWLDGREMADHGPMALRAARVGKTVTDARVLDERVCECCATAAVATRAGVAVAYRNRTEGEVRDIFVARYPAPEGEPPALRVHDDGWVIAGCPVNGPALAADGDRVVVAWFTAADGEPRVRVAFSEDGGRRFDEPVEVAAEGSLGRVGVALLDGAAIVSWLGRDDDEDGAAVWLRRVDPGGEMGAPSKVAATTAGRRSGVPQLVEHQGGLFVAWVEAGGEDEPTRVRVQGVDPEPLGSPSASGFNPWREPGLASALDIRPSGCNNE